MPIKHVNGIINDHPVGNHPFAVSLLSTDVKTSSNIDHRELRERGENEVFIRHMRRVLQEHHISPEALRRYQEQINSFRIAGLLQTPQSRYPKSLTTQKGNFAEIFLAEYLGATTEAELPVYRLRYNPNPEQSMKGDDVLLFDLDSDPVRIIVGESKFRSTPTKAVVVDIVKGLMRSNKSGLPVSLTFIADRLYEQGNIELGNKVMKCQLMFARDRLCIDYVGLLMSDHRAKEFVNKHTPSDLSNLLMISLGVQNPEEMVREAFDRLEEGV